LLRCVSVPPGAKFSGKSASISKNQQRIKKSAKTMPHGGKRPNRDGKRRGDPKHFELLRRKIKFFEFNEVFKVWRRAQFVPNGTIQDATERHQT
jgi:hypothetical protein